MKSDTSGWGFYEQGSDQLQEIMELGDKLNLAIDCPVHYPAFGKRLFECHCNMIFPAYVVRGNTSAKLKEFHTRGCMD